MMRTRLPSRRHAETQDLEIGGMRFAATVGFTEGGCPAEVFLTGAKDGSGMAAIIEDASVVISVALQHGVPATALAKSIARVPEQLDGPAVKAASVIGAALDLIAAVSAEAR